MKLKQKTPNEETFQVLSCRSSGLLLPLRAQLLSLPLHQNVSVLIILHQTILGSHCLLHCFHRTYLHSLIVDPIGVLFLGSETSWISISLWLSAFFLFRPWPLLPLLFVTVQEPLETFEDISCDASAASTPFCLRCYIHIRKVENKSRCLNIF